FLRFDGAARRDVPGECPGRAGRIDDLRSPRDVSSLAPAAAVVLDRGAVVGPMIDLKRRDDAGWQVFSSAGRTLLGRKKDVMRQVKIVSLLVKDYDAAIQFYTQKLGFQVAEEAAF